MTANTVTIFRTLLTLPLFAILAFGAGDVRWTALALFVGAGLLDMVDGQMARRLNQVSKLGACLDLIGDRLLTMAAVLGLMAGGGLQGWSVVGGVILVARCIVVASLNEALPGKLDIKVSTLEKVKIAASFIGLSLLIAPAFFDRQRDAGDVMVVIAAALTCVTLFDYAQRAAHAFKQA